MDGYRRLRKDLPRRTGAGIALYMRTAEINEALVGIIPLYSAVVRNTWNAVSRPVLCSDTAKEAAEPPSLGTLKTQLASSNLL